MIESINEDYDGYLDYEQFTEYMEQLDPKLMKPDNN